MYVQQENTISAQFMFRKVQSAKVTEKVPDEQGKFERCG
jgi:hypothetical protein